MELSILVISRTYKLINRLLKSISYITYLNKLNFEIICSWNGKFKDLKKIKIPENLSLIIREIKPYNFANNMNELIKISKGKFLLIINDDVILDKNSIEYGLRLINANNNIGLVGGNLRDRKNFLTHAGVNFNFLNSPYHFLEGQINYKVNFLKKNFTIPASTGALMLTKKEIFKNIKFNENNQVCGEDIELCLDIRQLLGMEIWFCHLFTGIHEAETTRKKMPHQKKNIFDKKRLMKRYSLFLKTLGRDQLLDIYNFDKKILNSIFKYKIKTFQNRINTDYWLIILINMLKIKIKILIKFLLINIKNSRILNRF